MIILGTIIVTSFIIVLIRRPEILQDFWLWIVGLAGFIAAPVKNLYDMLKEKLEGRNPGTPKARESESEVNLKKRVSDLETDLRRERDFYLHEIKTLRERIKYLDEYEPETFPGDLFEEEILTFIQSLTRRERRRLIRDGKLPGD